jgi:hypothetical protein
MSIAGITSTTPIDGPENTVRRSRTEYGSTRSAPFAFPRWTVDRDVHAHIVSVPQS